MKYIVRDWANNEVGAPEFKTLDDASAWLDATIDRLYGAGTAEMLIDLSEIRGQKVHTKVSLKILAKEFRLLAKAEAKKKGVEL